MTQPVMQHGAGGSGHGGESAPQSAPADGGGHAARAPAASGLAVSEGG